MTLLDQLRLADPARLALEVGAARLSYGDLVQQAEALRADLPIAAGLRLLLCTTDIVEAVVALAALDGVAGALVLTSPALEASTVQDLAPQSGAEAILSDRADLAGALPVMARAAELAALKPAGAEQEPVTDWIMTTSGTTGQPKLVVHKLESLTRTTRRDQARGEGQVWGLLYDYTRFAGLQVVLQSLLSGATLAVPPAALPLDQRLSMLGEAGVTHLSATPTLWRKILMTPGTDAMPLQQVTLGGEIADDAVLRALAARYHQARISHIFASTEAGVGFSVTDGRAGFPASYLNSPPQGILLKIKDDHLMIRNDRVGSEYLGGQGAVMRDGWVNTGDQVRREGDRILFLGRSSGIINVGGDKVHPEEVEAAILTHPDVRMVQVYPKKNPIMGALVAADVLPREGLEDAAALRAALKEWLSGRLERHKLPAIIRVVEEFETNAAGKLKRGAT